LAAAVFLVVEFVHPMLTTKSAAVAEQTGSKVVPVAKKAASSVAVTPVSSEARFNVPDIVNSDTVRDITALASLLEVRKLEAQLAKLDKEIADLRTASLPKPEIVPVPVMQNAKVPQDGTKKQGAASVDDDKPAVEALPSVISIEGLDGVLQASLLTRDGIRRVRVGDVLGQGKVDRIDAASVVLSMPDGQNKTLGFKE
jgi:type IV pilus biogenesis protein PilP